MSKRKRKNNPGGALLWVVLGLAAGGGLVWAYSEGVFDKKQKKSKTKEEEPKRRLPPPQDPDDDRFDNGITLNADCTRVESLDPLVVEEELANFVGDVLEAEGIDSPERLAEAEDPVDAIAEIALIYLSLGSGTQQCAVWSEAPSFLDDASRFESLIFLSVFSEIMVLLHEAGILSDEQLGEVATFVIEIAQEHNLSADYAESVGFPTQSLDQSIADASELDEVFETRFFQP
jgi:hypothetical protein